MQIIRITYIAASTTAAGMARLRAQVEAAGSRCRIHAGGFDARAGESEAERVAEIVEDTDPDVVVADLPAWNDEAMEIVATVKRVKPDTPVVVVQEMPQAGEAEAALRAGVADIVDREHDSRLGWVVCRVVHAAEEYRPHRRTLEALRDTERNYREIFENATEGIFRTSTEGKWLRANPALARMNGYETEDELLAAVNDIATEWFVDPARRRELLRRLDRDGKVANFVSQTMRHRTGERIWVSENARAVADENGKLLYYEGTIQEITERKRAEDALRKSEERFRVLYDNNPSILFIIDRDANIVSINRSGATQLGYTPGQLEGMPLTSLHRSIDTDYVIANVRAAFEDPDLVHRWESCKVGRSGQLIWVRESTRRIDDGEGNALLLSVCEDVTDAHVLSEQLSYQASHDALTGLYNRTEFERLVQRALNLARRDGAVHALCYLDLDQFKVINDTCGHVAGDELLRQMGVLLRRAVRKQDTLARLGGDEFGLLMEHCSVEQAVHVVEKLRGAIYEFRFAWATHSFNISLSAGIVALDSGSGSWDVLLSAADAACYTAKDQGRNRIHVYQEDDQALARRQGEMRWVARITAALDSDRMCLFGQPIVSTNGSGDAGWFEILLRMRDENGELIAPGAFLPAAERFNLTSRVDRWVLEQAMIWLERLHDAGSTTRFAINLSGTSIGDDTFLAYVISRVESAAVPADRLCFEITETTAITNLSRATQFIARLRQQGCRFALDDFGSGLSSFAYLKNLPVDYLKIDGLFVKDMLEDPLDLAMVRSINEIGHVMGKQTIAEFAERLDVLERLREIGVDYAQGFAIGEPRPLEQLAVLPRGGGD